jgi:hypothetical protein
MTRTMDKRLRLVGSLSGAAFAVVALLVFLINPGPASGDGVTVVAYYSAHATATLWAAALVGVAAICLIWFAETFAGSVSLGPAGLIGAGVTAALYLVAVGCWTILEDIYGGVDVAGVSSDGFSDAHVFNDIGVGAAHMGNFAAAAFVGATAAALLASAAPWRSLGWLGVSAAAFRLASALIELGSDTHWSDVVAIAGFLAFLAWVFIASLALGVATRPAARFWSDCQTVTSRPLWRTASSELRKRRASPSSARIASR